MPDPSRRSSRLSIKALWMVLILAGVIAGAAWWTARRVAGGATTQSADGPARAGDVKRGPDGRLLYFNGRQWTDTPLPPQDTPF